MLRVRTLFRLTGFPFLAANTGPDSGFPHRTRCASNMRARGLITGTALWLWNVLGSVARPSQIDCATWISPLRKSCQRMPQISPRLNPVNDATANIVAAGSGRTARIDRISFKLHACVCCGSLAPGATAVSRTGFSSHVEPLLLCELENRAQ